MKNYMQHELQDMNITAIYEELAAAINGGSTQKIAMIKALRELNRRKYGEYMGLRQAKDMIEDAMVTKSMYTINEALGYRLSSPLKQIVANITYENGAFVMSPYDYQRLVKLALQD